MSQIAIDAAEALMRVQLAQIEAAYTPGPEGEQAGYAFEEGCAEMEHLEAGLRGAIASRGYLTIRAAIRAIDRACRTPEERREEMIDDAYQAARE